MIHYLLMEYEACVNERVRVKNNHLRAGKRKPPRQTEALDDKMQDNKGGSMFMN